MIYKALTFTVVLFLAVSCSSSEEAESSNETQQSESTKKVTTTEKVIEIVEVPTQEDLTLIIEDLNAYWSNVDEELDFDYVPIGLDRVTTGNDGVLCNGEEIDPASVEDNAFVDPGCDEGILVAYDPAYVGASLARAESTFAHEWGHVIQAQSEDLDLSIDFDDLSIVAELQADCFAGVWAGDRAEASIARIRKDVSESGDPHEVEVDDPEAHGLPSERLDAFDVGFAGGPNACLEDIADLLE